MDSQDSILTRIVIRRNHSLDRMGLLRILGLAAGPSLMFIGLAAAGGWWPIFAFSLGVLLSFALVLWMVMTGGREREVVTVTARRVVVESGRDRPRTRVELDRYWTRVERRGAPRPALALVSRGVVVEIAAALGEAERKSLARRLAALVGPDAAAPNLPDARRAGNNAHRPRLKR